MNKSLWLLLALWFLLFIGDRLEHSWGAFRLNLYFLVGMLGTTRRGTALSSGVPAAGRAA